MARFKKGVRVDVQKARLPGVVLMAIAEADEVFVMVTGRTAIVTSLLEGEHSENSLHYEGKAFDLRTRDLTDRQVSDIHDLLEQRLNNLGAGNFDVIVEPTHIHVEWDPS